MKNKALIITVIVLSILLISISGTMFFINKNKPNNPAPPNTAEKEENNNKEEPVAESPKEPLKDYSALTGSYGYVPDAKNSNKTTIEYNFKNTQDPDIEIKKIKFEVENSDGSVIKTQVVDVNKVLKKDEEEQASIVVDLAPDKIGKVVTYYE